MTTRCCSLSRSGRSVWAFGGQGKTNNGVNNSVSVSISGTPALYQAPAGQVGARSGGTASMPPSYRYERYDSNFVLPPNFYLFKKVAVTNISGSFNQIMVRECKKFGMKPVCDHPGNCREGCKDGTNNCPEGRNKWSPDDNSIWIGNSQSLAYGQVSTRTLGRRTAPFPPFLIPHRVPHGFNPRS